MMKSVVVNRVLFFIFLAFALGIGLARFIVDVNLLIITFVCISIIALTILCICYKQILMLLCTLIAFTIGLSAFFIGQYLFHGNTYDGELVEVTGRISDNLVVEDYYMYGTLENVTINGNSDKNINVFINFYTSDITEEIKIGYYIGFKSQLYNYLLFEDNQFNHYAFGNNAPYHTTVDFEKLTIAENGQTLAEKFKLTIKETLQNTMSPNGAQLAYSILFGDQSGLADDIREDFSLSGTAHLIAVSGLNIGVLIGVLLLFFSRFRIKNIYKIIIIFCILLIYCYLCNFEPPVVRASIMAIVALIANAVGQRTDLLTSIGIAGLIILLISPLSVFDIGFQMSFACMIGLALLMNPICKFFQKLNFPKFLAVALAIDISTNLAIYPFIATYFGDISALSIFANLICIPVFSITYIFLFFNCLAFVVIPPIAALLFIPDFLLRFIILITTYFSNIDFAIIHFGVYSFISIVTYFLIMFVLSGFYKPKYGRITKSITAGILIFICIILNTIFLTTNKTNTITISQLNSSSPLTVITLTDGKTVLIAGNGGISGIEKYMKNNRLDYIDILISTENYASNYTQEWLKTCNIKTSHLIADGWVDYENFSFKYVYSNNVKKAVYIVIDNKNFVFLPSNLRLTKNDEKIFNETFKDVNIDTIYLHSNEEKILELFPNCKTYITREKIAEENLPIGSYNYSLYVSGTYSKEVEIIR